MATAEEMHYRPGDVAIFVCGYNQSSNGEGWGRDLASNQQVGITVGRVLRRDSEQTVIHVISTTDVGIKTLRDLRNDGSVAIHAGFWNFVAEGDERLKRDLEKANLQIRHGWNEEGVTVELVRANNSTQGPAIS